MAEFNIYWQDTLRTWLAWKGEAKDTDEALDKAARTLGQVWIVKFRSPYLMYHDGEEFLTLRLVDFFAPRYSRRIEKARKQKQVTLYHFGFHTGAFMAGEYEKFWKARKRKPLPPEDLREAEHKTRELIAGSRRQRPGKKNRNRKRDT